MKVLVTGGAGYIGSCAAKHLLDAGHEVVVFDSMELGHLEAVDKRARLIVGDLRRAAGEGRAEAGLGELLLEGREPGLEGGDVGLEVLDGARDV